MLDKTTLQLFAQFPREVGNPSRSTVKSLYEFENFITENNGINDCYTSVYPSSGVVDRVSFDSDGIGALSETKAFYNHLLHKGFCAIPIVSGKKGYHIHVLLKSKSYDNPKKLLLNATLKLLEDCFGVDSRGELRCSSFDSHPFGDLRRLIRIPNTLRPPENRNYCTYLPPDSFLDMTETEVALHMKAVHTYDTVFHNGLPILEDFPETKVKCKSVLPDVLSDLLEHPKTDLSTNNRLLKGVLRPCLYRHLAISNPRHDVRVACTIDLLNFFSPAQILKSYSELNWQDWNQDITEYQINHCRNLKPYSCGSLMKKGIPKECCLG